MNGTASGREEGTTFRGKKKTRTLKIGRAKEVEAKTKEAEWRQDMLGAHISA